MVTPNREGTMHDNGEDNGCCLSKRVHVFRDGLDPETQDIKWLKVGINISSVSCMDAV
jgi:hypothetical protein